MGISIRCYIIESDGTLKRVPKRVRDALPSGEDAVPIYAGTRQRVATVLLESDAGKPRKILDVGGPTGTSTPRGGSTKGSVCQRPTL